MGGGVGVVAVVAPAILARVSGAEVPHYSGRLLVRCADRPGIIAAVSRFLFEAGANIVSSNQWSSDPTGGSFFLRLEFVLDDFEASQAPFEERFAQEVAEPFGMDWEVRPYGRPRRLAILVSRCLPSRAPIRTGARTSAASS